MPNLSKTGVTLASNGDYWQAAWYDSRGRRCRKSIGPKSLYNRRAAAEQCHRLAAEYSINPRRRDANAAPTLEAWCDRYLESRIDLRESTRVMHAWTVRLLKTFFEPGFRIDRITRSGAADWRLWLSKRTSKNSREKISEASVCVHIRNAKVIFAHALNEDLIPLNPFDRVKGTAPRVEKTWQRLDEGMVDQLIAAAPTAPWKALLALCAFAGLRRGEALRLTWADVQWDLNRVVVLPAPDKGGRRVEGTKARRREVLLEPKLAKILLDCRESIDGPLVAPVNQANLHRDMIGEKDATGRVVYRGIIRTAGFEPWEKPFHTLRKWRATSWRGHYPENVVDAWLGHSLQVAREHYVAVPESMYTPADAAARVKELEAELAAARLEAGI